MTNATLRGKPDAENSHVRLDEGEVASGNPRRGPLLYNRMEFVTGICALASVGCAFGEGVADLAVKQKGTVKMKKSLVVYFSATGTTKAKAEVLAKVLNADLKEIVPAKRYTEADLNWHDSKSRSSIEMSDKSSRPAIAEKVANISDYDTVYVGFPIWWGVAPTVVNTFLEAHDLAGKRIVPFFTSGGSGAGQTNKYLMLSAPKSTFVEPKNLTRASESDIRSWAEKL